MQVSASPLSLLRSSHILKSYTEVSKPWFKDVSSQAVKTWELSIAIHVELEVYLLKMSSAVNELHKELTRLFLLWFELWTRCWTLSVNNIIFRQSQLHFYQLKYNKIYYLSFELFLCYICMQCDIHLHMDMTITTVWFHASLLIFKHS